METITCYDTMGKKYKAEPKKLIFRPSVYGVLIHKNQILLSRQWDGYDFPGGGMEKWETTEQTLAREFFEETGLKVKSQGIVSVENNFHYTHNKLYTPNNFWNWMGIYYLCRKIGGHLSKDNFMPDEKTYMDTAEWVDLGRINKIKFYNGTDSRRIIKRALKIINNKT